MKLRTLLLDLLAALVAIGFLGPAASAMTAQSESIEWWTNIADAIALGRVTKVSPKPSAHKESGLQQVVQCKIEETLNGKPPESVVFQHWFDPGVRGKGFVKAGGDRQLLPGDRVLLFVGRHTSSDANGVGFWANLTEPNPVWAPHAAYNNECKLLTDGQAILSLVRSRVGRGLTQKKRGLMVRFTAGLDGVSGTRWDFIITADPEFKEGLVRDLHAADWNSVEDAICNLVSYPGPETVALLRPLLNDKTAVESKGYTDESKKQRIMRKWYPLRQAAYLALTLLGEQVDPPDPISARHNPWLFSTGFEKSWLFPSGEWKRL
jgi:hypothetical protein